MVELHNLKPAAGSHRGRKRRGRGPGSGNGKDAGRGENGQKSRSGGSIARGFEGGQMPLQRRIPKRGFTPLKRTEYQIVNVGDLFRVDGPEVTPASLDEAGLIRFADRIVKILGTGEVSEALQVSAHAVSAGARVKIEAAGGSITIIERFSTADEDPAPEAPVAEAAVAEPEVAEPEVAEGAVAEEAAAGEPVAQAEEVDAEAEAEAEDEAIDEEADGE